MKSVFNSGALRRGLALTVLLGLLGTLHAGAQCVPTVSGIVGWWPGDGNANDITGTNNGTLQGGATASGPGFVAQGFTFDGTNSFVSIPDSPVLKPANLTIEAWILFRSLDSMGSGGSKAGQQYIVFKQNTRSGNFEGYYLAKQRGTGGDFFTFGVTSSAGVEVAASGAPGSVATNVWYHVAAVRGPSTVQLFVNGQLISQASVSFPQDYGTFPVFFGTSGQSYWDHKFNGSLDEVSLYNRALTSNEIAAIYAAGAAGKCKTVGAPVILTPPQSQTVAVGSNALFNVSVGGVTPFSYQWMLGSAPIASATGSSLTVSNAQLTDAGNYSVIVTNSIGSATSSVAVLTVLTPPGILTNPQSFTNAAGGAAMFSATAGGSAPLTYQWTFNGNNLSSGGRITGATSNVLTITGLTTTDAGGYALKVSNPVGVATSSVATLVVLSPPVVGNNPSSQTVTAGSNASFTVTASGTAPLGYQWRFNGANLSDGGQFNGSATPTLSITSVQTNNAGGYSVVVTNSIGSATSAVATLTVNVPGSCLPPPQGMIGWWPGEGSAADIVGPDNGILQGGATATASGEVGQAFSFDGTNNFVQIPDSPLLHPTNLTIEAWVRFTGLDSYSTGGSPPGDQYIVFKQNTRSGNFEGFDLSKTRFSNGDGFRFAVSSQLGVALEVDSTTRVTVGTWYHVAGVRGSNYIQLYVNGHLEGQTNANFPQDYGTLPVYFGTSGQSYWDRRLKGNLDEVSLYNRALSSTEIANIYAAGTGGKCKGQVPPTITVQPTNTTLVVGGNIAFSVSTLGSPLLTYQWYKDGLKLFDGGSISGSTNNILTITGAQLTDAGSYQVKVANPYGTVTSVAVLLTTGVPPPNDNFASAQAISGASGSVVGNNFNATKESGEPNHAGNAGGASVWYNWTAPSTSPVTFDTAKSSFNTLLAVYTGSSVSGLTQIAANDDISSNNVRSRLTFTPVSGTVYHIAVDGSGGANGNLTLRWANTTVPLPNLSIVASAVNPQIVTQTFDPSSCAVQEGLIAAGTRRIIRFSTQTENSGTADLFFGNPATNPLFVWAPCHAHYHFQNYMSYRLRDSSGKLAAVGLKVGFCILDVFRWSSSAPSNAKYDCTNQGIQVGWGDLYDSTLDGQWIDITGLPDGNYTMELEANPQGIIQETDYSNNLTTVPISIGNPNAAPLNDNFASPQTLLGGFSSVPGNTANATKQSGEPNHAGNAGGHSVWYQWTGLDTKPVTIDTIGSSFNTLLAVYTGSSLNALSVVASNDDLGPGTLQSRVSFPATSGTVYNIAVDGYNGASGNLILTLNQTIGNDNFAQCQFIGGVSGVVYGATAGATKETGEPNHAGNPGGSSIWYCWTAPINGTVTFDTTGSTFNTLLAVYTGSSLTALTPIASNDDIGGGNTLSRVTFNAVGLTMYKIAIDGYNGASGDTTMNWSLTPTGASLASLNSTTKGGMINEPGGPLLASQFLAEGACQLVVAGQPNQNYQIQTSCDLVHWTPAVTTLANNDGIAYFTDKVTMHSSQQGTGAEQFCGAGQTLGVNLGGATARFYRVVAAP